MRFITTCSESGWFEYGHALVDSWGNAPKGARLTIYTDGFEVPETEVVEAVPLSQLRDLEQFKRRHAGYVPPSWRFDVVKFSHKVYAMAHGAYPETGLVAWIDADCVFHQPMPADLMPRLLGDAYVGCFQRVGTYTETGLWVVNAAHHAHMAFMDSLTSMYETLAYRNLPEWHDCYVFDSVVRRMTRSGEITVSNMSGEHADNMHPMAVSEIGRYLDHRKGRRKALAMSPENPAAAQAAA